MKNLLKADFYKLLRSRSLYICSVIAFAFAVMIVAVLEMAQNLMAAEGIQVTVEGMDTLSMSSAVGQAFDGNIFLFTGIIIAIFVGSEFTNGTIRNTAGKAFSRSKIFLSKWITSIVTANILLVLYVALYCVLALVLWGYGNPGAGYEMELMKMTALQLMLNTAYTSIFVFISFLIRQAGGGVAANICFMSLISTLITFGELLLNRFVEGVSVQISKYTLSNIIAEVSRMNLNSELVIRAVLMSGVVLIFTMGMGMLSFGKRDIK